MSQHRQIVFPEAASEYPHLLQNESYVECCAKAHCSCVRSFCFSKQLQSIKTQTLSCPVTERQALNSLLHTSRNQTARKMFWTDSLVATTVSYYMSDCKLKLLCQHIQQPQNMLLLHSMLHISSWAPVYM